MGGNSEKNCNWKLNPQNQETFRIQNIWCRGWGGIILEIHKEYDYFFRTLTYSSPVRVGW